MPQLSPSACQLVLDAVPLAHAEVDATLARFGLNGREFLVLTLIGAADGVSEQAIGDQVRVASSRIRQIGSRLADQALVSRTGNKDGRQRITPAGVEVHGMVLDAICHDHGRFSEPLSPAAREALRQFGIARAAAAADVPRVWPPLRSG